MSWVPRAIKILRDDNGDVDLVIVGKKDGQRRVVHESVKEGEKPSDAVKRVETAEGA